MVKDNNKSPSNPNVTFGGQYSSTNPNVTFGDRVPAEDRPSTSPTKPLAAKEMARVNAMEVEGFGFDPGIFDTQEEVASKKYEYVGMILDAIESGSIQSVETYDGFEDDGFEDDGVTYSVGGQEFVVYSNFGEEGFGFAADEVLITDVQGEPIELDGLRELAQKAEFLNIRAAMDRSLNSSLADGDTSLNRDAQWTHDPKFNGSETLVDRLLRMPEGTAIEMNKNRDGITLRTMAQPAIMQEFMPRDASPEGWVVQGFDDDGLPDPENVPTNPSAESLVNIVTREQNGGGKGGRTT